jgi:hypothetical protein
LEWLLYQQLAANPVPRRGFFPNAAIQDESPAQLFKTRRR